MGGKAKEKKEGVKMGWGIFIVGQGAPRGCFGDNPEVRLQICAGQVALNNKDNCI